MLEYRAGSSNHVADVLSRRADLASLGSVAVLSSSVVATSIRDRTRELLPKDSAAQGLVHLVEQGKARQFWIEDGLLMTKENRLNVPKGGGLRKSLISECHDTLWAGYQGEERTYALVQRAYFWPQMRDDVETYVRTFLICQQDKEDHQKKASLLHPLPIPTRPWESVSMDYIFGLPKVGNLGSIIVVVDRLSKYATFIVVPKHVTAEGIAHLFFKHIVKYWGLPKDIVSDQDSRFTGVFWTELFKILGSKLSMSSSYHPQSDGQTERFNSMLEEYLWHFVHDTQKDWVKLLDVAQLCFNAQKSSSTNKSAFEIITGQQPLLLHTLDSPQSVRSPLARSFSQEWKQNIDIARSFFSITVSAHKAEKYGDFVLPINDRQERPVKPDKMHSPHACHATWPKPIGCLCPSYYTANEKSSWPESPVNTPKQRGTKRTDDSESLACYLDTKHSQCPSAVAMAYPRWIGAQVWVTKG
ncbi:UNVERIFIED_CONTAM: hypothetical protein Slati_4223200 [Sesamum latifolium]|uniref:Integrase catalytic domain-containing protein n=1 Tax=Sesamum latifolium TaxID=2727402 RepID=A0AAW2TBM3_9LAMI